jgi:hypothetical protein
MPRCPVCGQPTPCAGAENASHRRSPEGDVIPCSSETGAIWAQVTDSRGNAAHGATVRAAGRTSRTDAGGFAELDGLAEGAYDVALIGPLPAPHASHSRVPENASIPATVVAGQVTFVQIVLDPVNVLTPVIAPEYRVVLLDRGLAAHQAREPAANKLYASPTYIDVSLEQSDEATAPYAGAAKLELSPRHVDAFEDEACTKKLTRPLTARELSGPSPMRVWLRGISRGAFRASLTLDRIQGPKMRLAEGVAPVDMAVVELKMQVYEPNIAAAARLSVNPDKEPLDLYHQALQSLKLPDPIALSDRDKIARGPLLHVQRSGSHARTKLEIARLDRAVWPIEADAYEVYVVDASQTGSFAAYDAPWDGAETLFPLGPFKLSELRSAAKELWIEGRGAGEQRGVTLSLALDRAPGGPAHTRKENADAARMTVAEITEVDIDFTPQPNAANPWDAANNRFFINFGQTLTARELEIRAKLDPPIPGIPIRFMLVEHRDNRKAANWGVDLPTGPPASDTAGNRWVWKDISADLKHKDKSARKDFLHVAGTTDASGSATATVRLSRFGGDKFYLAAYLECDLHLAKHIDGHPDLGTRVPPMRAAPIQVWRKFWYKEIKVDGIQVAGLGSAPDVYEDVKAVMEAAQEVVMSRQAASAIRPLAIYPKHMVSYYQDLRTRKWYNNYPKDMSDAIVVGDANQDQFMELATPEAEKPVMIPMVNAHALWAAERGSSPGGSSAWTPTGSFPIAVDVFRSTLDPPLQGGTLLESGRWLAEDWDPATNSWTNARGGALSATTVSIDPGRSDPHFVQIDLPKGVTVSASGTRVRIVKLKVRWADWYLGTAYNDGIVNAYTPNDVQDFYNTAAHEIGHKLGQVPKKTTAGIPGHFLQYDNQGSHCSYQSEACLMYESGPQPHSLNRYCPVCQPYLLVADMSRTYP